MLMTYNAHNKQKKFHLSKKRTRAAFAGKRGGKTECGAIEAIMHVEGQPGQHPSEVDPYLGLIVAPTSDMLVNISLKKFLGYSKAFAYDHNVARKHLTWHNGSEVLGISADKPERLEGLKASWIWIDEVFQVKEQIYTEAIARLADTEGRLWVTGSLGVQYKNPKAHWAYKRLVEHADEDIEVVTWATSENPYFPPEELRRLKDQLDPKTYRQLFTFDWNVMGGVRVYDDFDEFNVIDTYRYDKNLETTIAVDWGWAHEMACLFFQYDKTTDTVTCFDEIVSSRMTLEKLWNRIVAKRYKIDHYVCDISGTQEREQTGISNIRYFREKHNIGFKSRSTAITYGIPIVRSYIKNGLGQRKLLIHEKKCPKTLDGMYNYGYKQKDGTIVDEKPEKKSDDCMDALRYYFVNMRDTVIGRNRMKEFDRWGAWKF